MKIEEALAIAREWSNTPLPAPDYGFRAVYKTLYDEINRLREANKALHRRCQGAEAAIPEYRKLVAPEPDGNGLRFVSGSLGRALLASQCERLRAEADRLRQLDSAAAQHVETTIISRTGFTGEPPYVGWVGLGLAVNEALDERDALRVQVSDLRGAIEADEARLTQAGERVGLNFGCDTAEWMADEIFSLREQVTDATTTVRLIADLSEWHRGDDGRMHLAFRVADGADLSCKANRRAALMAAVQAAANRNGHWQQGVTDWEEAEALRRAGIALEYRDGSRPGSPWRDVDGPITKYCSDFDFRRKGC